MKVLRSIAFVLLTVAVGCSSQPPTPPSRTPPVTNPDTQTPALTNCPMPSLGVQGDAVFGPIMGGGNLEYTVPLYYASVIPQLHATDAVNTVYGYFQGNYWTCWDATPSQWRADGHERGYRGMCGDTGVQYATVALHVVDYGTGGTGVPADEYWFQQVDPSTGLSQWYGGKPYTTWAWWYYSWFGCSDLNPPYPRY